MGSVAAAKDTKPDRVVLGSACTLLSVLGEGPSISAGAKSAWSGTVVSVFIPAASHRDSLFVLELTGMKGYLRGCSFMQRDILKKNVGGSQEHTFGFRMSARPRCGRGWSLLCILPR